MIDTSASRQTILARIRGASAEANPELAVPEYKKINSTYVRSGSLNTDQRLDLFEERVVEYDAHVRRVSESTLVEAVATAIGKRDAQRIAVPAGIPTDWLPSSIPVIEADSLSNVELDQFDGLVSGCTVAIALTGTIILQNAPAQGPRKLSLIPDYHLCVVLSEQIVETVSEAFDRLAQATATLCRPRSSRAPRRPPRYRE